jgi:hypothetical protein
MVRKRFLNEKNAECDCVLAWSLDGLLRDLEIIGLTRQVQVEGRPDALNISDDTWKCDIIVRM